MGVAFEDGVTIADTRSRPKRRVSYYRHSAVVRVTHWVNVLAVVILLMSGLQIFNAHPALYWGIQSDFDHPLAAIGTEQVLLGGKIGVTTILGRKFDTTGVLGLFTLPDGQQVARAFPAWATLPGWQSLAGGRLWHFFFAWVLVLNGAIYALNGLLAGHFWRDLVPSRAGLRRLGRTAWDHLRLRFPEGDEARHYNSIQQIIYLVVVFVIFPVLILAGLAMSPRLDASLPWLLGLFGGRQSARTIHFIAAFVLVAFAIVHVLMVVLSGPWNNLRSMATGRYAIRPSRDPRA